MKLCIYNITCASSISHSGNKMCYCVFAIEKNVYYAITLNNINRTKYRIRP